jgi:uncharacterized protein YodC (DUF2158 family)
MAGEAFKVGDVVQLRSGGPLMTVTNAGNDTRGIPTVWCAWFQGTKQEAGAFPAGAVELYQE